MCRRFSALILLGFILGLALASVSEAALVGWWKFDDGSGTVAKDSSGLHHDGTVINPDWVTGHYGGALNFTGTNYVDVPAESWSTIRTQATVCFWAYGDPAQQPQANFIFGAFSDPANNEARRMSAHVPWSNGNIYFDTGGPGYNRINQAGNASDYEGTWTFWTFLKNADTGDQQIYINGVLWLSGTGMTNTMEGVTKFTIGTKPSLAEGWYRGMIDDFRLYDEALTVDQILDAMTGRGPSAGAAADPVPAAQATDVLRDMGLTWTGGEFAGTHDVYLGTVFADVNEATRTSPQDVLVSQGQTEPAYQPAALLDFGQTYYWRVDEVNAPPDSTIFKGETWSFTVEPYGYPVTPIAATASSFQPGMDPANTINGSGLSDDLHGIEPTTMWMSAGVLPNWIQYEFDQVYKLHDLQVWNSNQLIEGFLGFGAKTVTIETSLDGATWAPVADVPEFTQAPGTAGYAANTAVNLGGAEAKYVKLTIESNWGGVAPQTGLAEVRFSYVPVRAFRPQPATGTEGVAIDTALDWRPGREATSHQVFFGADQTAVTEGTTPAQTVTDHGFSPGSLDLATTYYWRVDEVGAVTYAGDIWSFTTQEYLVVDDFESYGDDLEAMNAVFDTWVDGFGNPAQNGAVVGLATAVNGTFCDTTIFYGGKASMPFAYDNTAAPLSEAVRTFVQPQDWTQHGCRTLVLAFYGDPDNTGTPYLKINGAKVAYNGKAEDLQRTQWQAWNIDLAATGANLKSVTTLALGVDGAGAAGMLRFDDIRLYPTPGEMITPVDPGQTGLVAWYKFDGDFKDSAGANAGTARGDAKIVTDPVRGQVLSLDGVTDGVAVPNLGSGNSLTIAMWVNTAVDPVPIQFESFFHANGWEAGDLHWRYSYGKVNSGINGAGADLDGVSIAKPNQWNHVAITVSPTECALWLNGLKDASRTLATPATVTLGEGLIGAWLGTDGVTISRAFTGTIDDARFYDRALSPAEIAFLADRTEPFAKPF